MAGGGRLADRIPARLSASEGRKFAFTVGGAFAVLAAFTWWRDHQTAMRILGSLAAALGLAGLIVPSALGPLQRAWMGLAHLISKVTTPLFMGIIYFVIITPISFLMRAFGKRFLGPAPEAQTYWRSRPEGTRRGDLTRQF